MTVRGAAMTCALTFGVGWLASAKFESALVPDHPRGGVADRASTLALLALRTRCWTSPTSRWPTARGRRALGSASSRSPPGRGCTRGGWSREARDLAVHRRGLRRTGVLDVPRRRAAGGCASSASTPTGMNWRCLSPGDAGPVVVLESGLPGGMGWPQVQAAAGRLPESCRTRARASASSDPGPQPRDANRIAAELHSALRNAHLPPPYVMVGQSMGGPYVRVFAAAYPDDVAGLVSSTRRGPTARCHDRRRPAWFADNRPEQWERVEALC